MWGIIAFPTVCCVENEAKIRSDLFESACGFPLDWLFSGEVKGEVKAGHMPVFNRALASGNGS